MFSPQLRQIQHDPGLLTASVPLCGKSRASGGLRTATDNDVFDCKAFCGIRLPPAKLRTLLSLLHCPEDILAERSQRKTSRTIQRAVHLTFDVSVEEKKVDRLRFELPLEFVVQRCWAGRRSIAVGSVDDAK